MVHSDQRAGVWTQLQSWAARLKGDIVALFLAGREPRVPLAPKLLAAAVAAYALSPIDLIPDFIPVLGLLDDLILVPSGIALAVRLIPPEIMHACRVRAAAIANRKSYAGAAAVALVWAAASLLIVTAILHGAL